MRNERCKALGIAKRWLKLDTAQVRLQDNRFQHKLRILSDSRVCFEYCCKENRLRIVTLDLDDFNEGISHQVLLDQVADLTIDNYEEAIGCLLV